MERQLACSNCHRVKRVKETALKKQLNMEDSEYDRINTKRNYSNKTKISYPTATVREDRARGKEGRARENFHAFLVKTRGRTQGGRGILDGRKRG